MQFRTAREHILQHDLFAFRRHQCPLFFVEGVVGRSKAKRLNY